VFFFFSLFPLSFLFFSPRQLSLSVGSFAFVAARRWPQHFPAAAFLIIRQLHFYGSPPMAETLAARRRPQLQFIFITHFFPFSILDTCT
jgi:hypothetical protein